MGGRYIICLYYAAGKGSGGKEDVETKKRKLEEAKEELQKVQDA